MISSRNIDELGEIAVTDKRILLILAMDGYTAKQIFSYYFFFYFFYLLFYLGHGHVAGLGAGLDNLTSSLSAHARVYGKTRLRSLLVDSGSNRACLTLEWRTVTWGDGCGHTDEHSAILRTCLPSLAAVFWWGVIGTTNKTIHGACVWIRPGVSSVRSCPRACLLLTGTDLVRFTWFVVEARRYLRVNDPGLHRIK